MSWQAYEVVFALRSPLHAGYRKLGNVQQTRPYLPGKNLWAALTARLTRDDPGCGGDYLEMGQQANRCLAFSYFYLSTQPSGEVTLWPWGETETECRYQFLAAYASTALDYTCQAAEEASLHEIECICPHTRDGAQVYLSGYVLATDHPPARWKQALYHLQVGGERGYGWGRVKPVIEPAPCDGQPLFGGRYTVEPDGQSLVLVAAQDTYLLAHALAADFDDQHKAVKGVDGVVEPVVGRETDPEDGRFGVRLSRARICYVPGSRVDAGARFRIGPYGIWEHCPAPDEGSA